MKVFKFGGASVKDAESVKNVGKILSSFADGKVLTVISAMGKTTNALEKVADAFFKKQDFLPELQAVQQYHESIAKELFNADHRIFHILSDEFTLLKLRLKQRPSANFDYEYDQIVSMGEVISTLMVSEYLCTQRITCSWVDSRRVVSTDRTFREGKVDWKVTAENVARDVSDLFSHSDIVVTQGFIGYTPEGHTTTLGREGSDYTAAIYAWCLKAENVTIWKDVPGMLNADPKFFPDAVMLKKISFKEALELSYYGATVIHPKTIKPLQNRDIPLYVKSFLHPEDEGSVIQKDHSEDHLIPSYIFKNEQLLISLSPKDFSFVVEENLRDIFEHFSKYRVKINLMQNSALDFSAVVDKTSRAEKLVEELKSHYRVRYNANQQLMTIRHYTPEIIEKVTGGRTILLEQRTRQTLRMVLSPN